MKRKRLPVHQLAAAIKPYGFVYVFAALNLVKVGMTRYSLYRRWWGIKVGNPWLEPPLYWSPPLMGEVFVVEKACHQALRKYRAVGEWFECPRLLAVETVQGIVAEVCDGKAGTPEQVESSRETRAPSLPRGWRIDRTASEHVAHLDHEGLRDLGGTTRHVWT